MKADTPLARGVAEADRAYCRFNLNRDRVNTMREVSRLATAGVSHKAIAGLLNISVSHVGHIVTGKATMPTAAPIPQPDLTPARAAELEHTAETALDLACRLRDEHPQLTWDALNNLGRDELMALAVILLAAIPVDSTKSELFAWVYDLPAALETTA